jgi:hypothetical protein
MSAPTPVDPCELAARFRRLLDAISASCERPRDRPTRHRLEGAYICACLLAGLDPFDDGAVSLIPDPLALKEDSPNGDKRI